MSGFHRETGQGGLERLVISTGAAEAHIYLHGAHITHFQPQGQRPVLWMSGQSQFEKGKPIRGGVPICFPWFGAKANAPHAPAHGLARTALWDLVSTETMDNGSIRVALALDIEPFMLTQTLTIGQSLMMRLNIYNRSQTPAACEAALHTYLAVSDVRTVQIRGLALQTYRDKVEGGTHVQTDDPLRIGAETDRVYLNTPHAVEVIDPGWQRKLVIEKSDSQSTVIWNPWIAKAARMSDFGDDEWPGMLCVETANVAENQLNVPPRRSLSMSATISVSSLG